jgi:hypothetical protein
MDGGLFPRHLSRQKLVFCPFPNLTRVKVLYKWIKVVVDYIGKVYQRRRPARKESEPNSS